MIRGLFKGNFVAGHNYYTTLGNEPNRFLCRKKGLFIFFGWFRVYLWCYHCTMMFIHGYHETL